MTYERKEISFAATNRADVKTDVKFESGGGWGTITAITHFKFTPESPWIPIEDAPDDIKALAKTITKLEPDK